VLDEEVTERRDDRNAASAGTALGVVRLPVAAHAALDADQTVDGVAPCGAPSPP